VFDAHRRIGFRVRSPLVAQGRRAFHPTISKFRADGFVRVRKGEYISWRPQQAVSAETIPMAEALNRWNVEACYVDDLDALIERLDQDGIHFDEQT
jgi:hypothetical protein